MDREVTARFQKLRHVLGLRSFTYSVGSEPIDIWELASPLRYDIVIRSEYFSFLADHLNLYHQDFKAYLRQTGTLPYFTWFAEVASLWQRGYDRADPARLMTAYAARVRKTTELYLRFQKEGFNPKFPISIRTVRPGSMTSTGKLVERAFHVGDGGHRLALLLNSGQRFLPPELYRIRSDPLPAPIDNTHLLIRRLRLSRETYYAYLSRGYGDQIFTDGPSLIAHVERSAPLRKAELEAVIAIDESQLADMHDAVPGSSS